MCSADAPSARRCALDDIWRDSESHNHHSSSAKQEVPEALDDMLPVLVASEVVIANVEVNKHQSRKEMEDRQGKQQPMFES